MMMTLSCIRTMEQNKITTAIATCRCFHRLRCLPHRPRHRLLLRLLPHGVQYRMTPYLKNA